MPNFLAYYKSVFPFSERIRILQVDDLLLFEYTSKIYCVKICSIQNKQIFNSLLEVLSCGECYYNVVANDYGKIITTTEKIDFYIYEYIEGNHEFVGDDLFGKLGVSIFELHKDLSSVNFHAAKEPLQQLYLKFLKRQDFNLANYLLRRKYIDVFISKTSFICPFTPSLIHGDLWFKNIIVNYKGFNFIDFDNVKLFYSEYEFMRFFL